VVVASINSCASTSLTRRTATTLDLSSSATRTLDPLISGRILRRRIDSQPSRCVSWQTLGCYPLLDRESELEGHVFSNRCEGPVWLGRLSMEHFDPQHEEDLARVEFLIAACHHSRNKPFGKFEPCLVVCRQVVRMKQITIKRQSICQTRNRAQAQQLTK
jgi:hypothetical protein